MAVCPGQPWSVVGWVERSDTHRHDRMGFAKAQPILRKAPRRSRQDCDQRFPSAGTYTTPAISRAIAKVDQYDNRGELRRV